MLRAASPAQTITVGSDTSDAIEPDLSRTVMPSTESRMLTESKTPSTREFAGAGPGNTVMTSWWSPSARRAGP